MSSPANFEAVFARASKNQKTSGFVYLSYLLHKEFVENYPYLKDHPKASQHSANDHYHHFFTPEYKQRVAKEASEVAGQWHDCALDQIRNNSVGELRANFKRAFPEEKRFAQTKGQKEKQGEEDGYWTNRLKEIYGPEGHPETLTGGRNRQAQNYLSFLRLKVLMNEIGVTFTDIINTPKKKGRKEPSVFVEVVGGTTGIRSCATKLARLRAAYMHQHGNFYLRLPEFLKVDLTEDEPLEYDYTRDYTTLSEHLNGINGRYGYLMEYPEAASGSPASFENPDEL